MGTVLSVSPQEEKEKDCPVLLNNGQCVHNTTHGHGVSITRHSVLVSAVAWKNLITASAKSKVKSAQKVNPKSTIKPSNGQVVERLNNENNKKSLQNPESKVKPLSLPVKTAPTQNTQSLSPVLVPTTPAKISAVKKQPSNQSIGLTREVIVQASTGELLNCLGDFVRRRCHKLKGLTSGEVILWFRNVDRTLLIQGWQDLGFITPANLVFVYLLCKDTVSEDIESYSELHGVFLSCLYMAYSYMGHEISYPLFPFMIDANRDVFWDRSLTIIDRMSGKMLQLNSDPHFFTEIFQELKELRETEPANRENNGTSNVDR